MKLRKGAHTACVTLLLLACAKPYVANGANTGISARQDSTPSNQLVKQGLEYLRDRNYEDAQKVFGAAVKLSPTSSTVHVLNGIGYHLDYLNGAPDNKQLAETAYNIAFSLDTSDTLPIVQLGRLYIDSGEYIQAKKQFIRAVSVNPNNSDALFGLLQAALLTKDIKTGVWAGDRLRKHETTGEHQKLLALMYALAGDKESSELQVQSFEKSAGYDISAGSKLKLQLDYVNKQTQAAQRELSEDGFIKVVDRPAELGVHTSRDNVRHQGRDQRSERGPGGGQNTPVTSAEKAKKLSAAKKATNSQQADSSTDDSSDDGSDDSTTTSTGGSSAPLTSGGMGGGGAGGGYGGGGGSEGGSPGASGSQAAQDRKWFDCDVNPGLGKAPGGGYGVPVGGTSGDQTLYLSPLPAPCRNAPQPKMAMIDTVLIRTVDTTATSNGVNLLTGLQTFAGAQRTTTTGQTPINASVIGVGNAASATLNGVSGLVTYSMNIANSISAGSQVVARPTLTALDRVPSTFYSGQVQTVGLNGGGVSGAQVSNVPTGTSLSVTPTFIDDETMMLAVKVTRSFIDSAAPVGGFSAGISTQNHSVTANVRIKYGETLVLDGLTDRNYNRNRDGVPILQDIPIIQYLFSNLTKANYAENVLVLITPRRVVANIDDVNKMETELLKKKGKMGQRELGIYEEISLYEKLQNGRTNADAALYALQRDSTLFREFKNNVLISNDWLAEPSAQQFLDSAANTLYYH